MINKVCEKCGQVVKPPKPELKVGQELFACLGWDKNRIERYEVGACNRRSFILRVFEPNGKWWSSTGFGYKDIGKRIFFTKEEAIKNPV